MNLKQLEIEILISHKPFNKSDYCLKAVVFRVKWRACKQGTKTLVLVSICCNANTIDQSHSTGHWLQQSMWREMQCFFIGPVLLFHNDS